MRRRTVPFPVDAGLLGRRIQRTDGNIDVPEGREIEVQGIKGTIVEVGSVGKKIERGGNAVTIPNLILMESVVEQEGCFRRMRMPITRELPAQSSFPSSRKA